MNSDNACIASNAELRSKRLLRKDEYQRKFEHANTGLAIAGLSLADGQIDLATLHDFNVKSLALAQLCRDYGDQPRQINVLQWLGQRMLQLSVKCENLLCAKLCRLNATFADQQASKLSHRLGNIVSLPVDGLQKQRCAATH